ncbi:fimbrillin family protein [Dysgonomonas sp. BGC7]|uniref:fimbrillin family protein n=1 Tax=Dysgonomonas sp. BGC7 TaxID=1658008 RepID=UPI000682D75C|nr:fimbrillin family protein [Dysgonomonas sp. BGC7]MBD8387783.1 fimbrillin family protein [Dysgonomonas sp. BGC7]
MKTKLLSALTLSAVLFAACSNDNEEPADNWNGEIHLTTASADLRMTKAAPDDQIASGQQIGLYISEDALTPAVTYMPNLAHTANGSGGLTGTTQYYPETGSGVKISGYHPYNSGLADVFDFSVTADQSVNANYYNSDLLYSAEANYARQKTAHTLTFDHLLTKITYTLVAGSGSPDLSGATVKIINTLPTVEFDRIAGTVSAAKGTVTAITPNAGGAIIVPQTIAAGTKLIEVTLASGGTLYHTVPTGGVNFAPRQQYNYAITVNLTGISMSTSVTPWQPVGKQVTAEMD